MDRYAGSWQDMEEKGDTMFHTDNTANRNLKPVLSWMKDCFASLVRVFSSNLKNVRRTWLVGRTTMRAILMFHNCEGQRVDTSFVSEETDLFVDLGRGSLISGTQNDIAVG